MFHYVYRIDNLINGKIYIGKHSTEDLDDGYMGSGKLLIEAFSKYGIENFKKSILKEFSSSDEAFEFERRLVDEQFIKSHETYNLSLGGNGPGWHFPNKSIWNNLKFKRQHSLRVSERNKRLHAEGKMKAPDWTGRHHREETKRKIGQANSISQLGEKNSQFGTMWVYHPDLKKSQKIKKDELDSFLEQGWTKGRKMK